MVSHAASHIPATNEIIDTGALCSSISLPSRKPTGMLCLCFVCARVWVCFPCRLCHRKRANCLQSSNDCVLHALEQNMHAEWPAPWSWMASGATVSHCMLECANAPYTAHFAFAHTFAREVRLMRAHPNRQQHQVMCTCCWHPPSMTRESVGICEAVNRELRSGTPHKSGHSAQLEYSISDIRDIIRACIILRYGERHSCCATERVA